MPEHSATHQFSAALWRYDGPTAWFFVALPPTVSDEIADAVEGRTHGFGSVRVEVTLGSSTWQTSLFPDRRRATYLLPVKKAVRVAEGVDDGDELQVTLSIRAA